VPADYLLDSSTVLYGRVEIGPGCIIESGVVLGHPAPEDVARSLWRAPTTKSTNMFYRQMATRATAIGSNSIIRSGSVIYAGARLGSNLDCGHNVIVRENAMIGDGVYLKNNTEVMKGVVIGNGCRVAGVLADNSVLGDRVSSFGVLTHRYPRYLPPRRPGESASPDETAAPTIEDGAIVGRGAVILGPRVIGASATVGVNSVVTFDVPRGTRVFGPTSSLSS